MTSIEPSWGTPLLSSEDPGARAAYREAVVALVAGLPHAGALLDRALQLDPGFFLAQVAASLRTGGPVPVPPVGCTRGERQHAEVVRAFLTGDEPRAGDLRRLHLEEFPGDLVVVWLPTRPPAAASPSREARP